MYYAESVNEEKAFPAIMCPDQDTFERENCNNRSRTDFGKNSYMGYAADPR